MLLYSTYCSSMFYSFWSLRLKFIFNALLSFLLFFLLLPLFLDFLLDFPPFSPLLTFFFHQITPLSSFTEPLTLNLIPLNILQAIPR